jgi:hypothetical protein
MCNILYAEFDIKCLIEKSELNFYKKIYRTPPQLRSGFLKRISMCILLTIGRCNDFYCCQFLLLIYAGLWQKQYKTYTFIVISFISLINNYKKMNSNRPIKFNFLTYQINHNIFNILIFYLLKIYQCQLNTINMTIEVIPSNSPNIRSTKINTQL